MRVFERLRALRAFEKQHLHFLGTDGGYHLIGEIGHHQAKGRPLTLKQLFHLDVGSIATVQRHLRRLKELGLVLHRRAASDRRAVELTLSPECVRILAKYDALMTAKPAARGAPRRSGQPKHVCGLCDSDEGRRNLLVTFLAQGLKHGGKCVLVAPAEAQNSILADLHPRRRAREQIVVSEGNDSADAQLGFLKRVSREAKRAGQAMCLAADMSWTLSQKLPIDSVLDIETRFDALAGQFPLTGLCVYDTRDFSSADFLRAVKCHRDHLRFPIMLG